MGNLTFEADYWGRAEDVRWPRPAYSVTPQRPGTDVACETAAALAAAAVVFADADPEYAATLLEHARQLHSFGDTHRGLYSSVVPGARLFARLGASNTRRYRCCIAVVLLPY